MIRTSEQLFKVVRQVAPAARVAIDTEADSLHCYREKLCLLQVSVPGQDFVIDPLAKLDLEPLCEKLVDKQIVLHGADFDLRLLRRSLNFVPARIFDTVIAARLVGIREFSLAALVKRFFDVELTKGSQKANWAQRPLPHRMLEYAINDTHYLLGLAEKLEEELRRRGRIEWFEQSCQRALEQSLADRSRDADEAWRISGAGVLRGRAAAVLRELWNWREREAEAADRPPFHILQNSELLSAAASFANGGSPDYKHFSAARRASFKKAAERALALPEKDWPIQRRRGGTRPTSAVLKRTEELKTRRDHVARQHDLEPSFIASRSTIEAIAADESRAQSALIPWQRALLDVDQGDKDLT
jgi:ribonuclease D